MGLFGLVGYLVIPLGKMRRRWQVFERPTINGEGDLNLGLNSVAIDESFPSRK